MSQINRIEIELWNQGKLHKICFVADFNYMPAKPSIHVYAYNIYKGFVGQKYYSGRRLKDLPQYVQDRIKELKQTMYPLLARS